MLIIFLRTVFLFILLSIALRLMGKRHMGELEIGELVTTLMVSEFATLPIENPDIPLLNAIIPIATLVILEILSSLILTKLPSLRMLVSPKPSVIIRKGVLDQRELSRLRISIEELMSVLRQNNVPDIADVAYAIMEQNAKITVIPKADASPVLCRDLKIKTCNAGIPHIIIEDGAENKYNLSLINKDRRWLMSELAKRKLNIKDVFLMTADDNGELNIIMKEKSKK